MQKNEVLGFVFDATKTVSELGLQGGPVSGHDDLVDRTKILIWTDSATDDGFKLLSTVGGQISLGFKLTRMAIFGSMGKFYKDYMYDNFKIGITTANNLYVSRKPIKRFF